MGTFASSGLLPGHVRVIAKSPACGSADTDIELQSDSFGTPVEFALRSTPGSTIVVKVTDDTGTALQGVAIEMHPVGRPKTAISTAIVRDGVGGRAASDEARKATWRSIKAGRYVLRITTNDGVVPKEQIDGD